MTPNDTLHPHPARASQDSGALRAPSIGEMLLASGRLKKEDIPRVESHQLSAKSGFGEAALELGLVSADDIRLVLARQYRSRTTFPAYLDVPAELVCAVQPDHPVAEAVYRIRTALLLAHKGKPGPLKIAVVGVGRHEGRTLLAANLAIAFAQIHARTVLVDGDIRHGRMHRLFDIGNEAGLAAVLLGRTGIVDAVPVLHHNLAVLAAGSSAHPQELLSPSRFRAVMARLAQKNDVLIVDTPAAQVGVEAQVMAAETGLALLVTRLHHGARNEVRDLVRALARNDTTTLAVPFR